MSRASSESVFGCSGQDVKVVASKAMLDILKVSLFNGVANDWSLPCLGKILCNCKYLIFIQCHSLSSVSMVVSCFAESLTESLRF